MKNEYIESERGNMMRKQSVTTMRCLLCGQTLFAKKSRLRQVCGTCDEKGDTVKGKTLDGDWEKYAWSKREWVDINKQSAVGRKRKGKKVIYNNVRLKQFNDDDEPPEF